MLVLVLVTAVFAAPLLLAAYRDFDAMTIPNTVVLAMMAGFFLTLPLTWMGAGPFLEHLAVGGVFFVAGFALFAFGLIGGGDAKLMAAIALWFGYVDAVAFVLYTTIFGAAIAIALILSRRFVPSMVKDTVMMRKLLQGESHMPYGLALAAGALYVWPTSALGMALAA